MTAEAGVPHRAQWRSSWRTSAGGAATRRLDQRWPNAAYRITAPPGQQRVSDAGWVGLWMYQPTSRQCIILRLERLAGRILFAFVTPRPRAPDGFGLIGCQPTSRVAGSPSFREARWQIRQFCAFQPRFAGSEQPTGGALPADLSLFTQHPLREVRWQLQSWRPVFLASVLPADLSVLPNQDLLTYSESPREAK